MAIKWNITGKAMEARGHMDAISRAYDRLNGTARDHRADIEGLADQVDDMQSDLEHAANVMGNGGGHSGESGKAAGEPKPSPGQLTPSELKAAVEAANGQRDGVPTRVADLVEDKA